MSAGSYGLIVEGAFDSAVYGAIIGKLSPGVPVMSLTCGGKADLMKKFPSLLKAFEYEVAGQPVEMAIVICDADGNKPAEVEALMLSKIAARQYPFAMGVRFFAAEQAMESWLLADVSALNRVSQRRGGKTVTKSHDAPETLGDPKGTLRKLLTDHKLDYTAALASEIAQEIDRDTLSRICPRFRVFSELVDC